MKELLPIFLKNHDRFGDVFSRHECVSRINRHPHVVQSGLLCEQEGVGRPGHEAEIPRFLRLVFEGKPNVRCSLRHLGDVLEKPSSFPDEIRLQRIVVSILPRPQVDNLAPERSSHLDAFKGVVERLLPDILILGGKRTASPALLGEVVGDDRDALQAMLVQHLSDLLDVLRGHIPCSHELDSGNSVDFRSLTNQCFLWKLVLVP